MEATTPEGENSLWYSSAFYDEPEAPHTILQSSGGVDWYAMQPNAAAPEFESMDVSASGGNPFTFNEGAEPISGSAPSGIDAGSGPISHGTAAAPNASESGTAWYAAAQSGSEGGFTTVDAVNAYNRAQFQSFMPGYEQSVVSVDGSMRQDGQFEVRHENGTGTRFYDTTRYAAPRGDHKVYEDVKGGTWYAIRGEAAVERKPVYERGKAVYDGKDVKTATVETVRYKSTPTRFYDPKPRKMADIKPPKRTRP